MKNHIISFAAAALCVFAASCSKDIKDNNNGDIGIPAGFRAVTFAACGENAKTALQADKTINWVAGDEIVVYWGSQQDQKASAAAAASGAETTFSPVAIPQDCEKVYAVYPAAANSSVDADGAVSITIPAEQQGGFAGSNYAVATASAVDNSWDGTVLQFKNAASFLKVEVTDPAITKVVFTAVGGKAMTGTVKATFDAEGAISVAVPETSGDSVILNIPGTGVYYAAVIPGVTYDQGVLVDFYKDTQKLPSYYYRDPVTATRAKILSFSALDTRIGDYYVSPEGAGTKSGKSADNAMDAALFKDFISQKSDSNESAAQAAQLSGSTVHFAAGTYDFGDVLTVGFDSGAPAVDLKFEGVATESDSTIFTGADTHQILYLEKGTLNLGIKGIVFCHSAGNGGGKAAVRVNKDQPLALDIENCVFRHNFNTATGAGINISSGDATVKNCTFHANGCTQGSAINIDAAETSTLNVENCSFTGNYLPEGQTAGECGAVRIRAAKKVTFTSCTFSGNSGVDRVAFGMNNADVEVGMSHCVISGNKMTDNSAVGIMKGTFTAEYCDFTGNDATGAHGAALWVNGAASAEAVKLNNCTFKGNTGKWGGAIYCSGSGIATFTGCTFGGDNASDGNTATACGCVAAADAGTLNFVDCTAKNNVSSDRGGVYYAGGGTINVSGGTYTSNKAKIGGIAHAQSKGTINFTNVSCTGNNATTAGGVASVRGNATLSITGGTFESNNASKCGGVVYIYCETAGEKGNVTITGATFDSNTSKNGGGAIRTLAEKDCTDADYVNATIDVSNCIFKNNAATGGYGGALDIRNSGVTTVSKCLFESNHTDVSAAYGKGGAVSVCGNGAAASGGKTSFTECVFKGNHTIGSAAYSVDNGGAVNVGGNGATDFGYVTMFDKCLFDSNWATQGGAIHIAKYATAYMNDCAFTGNYIVYRYGSTISSDQCKLIAMNNCTIADNTYSTTGSSNQCSWINTKTDKMVVSNCSFIGVTRKNSSESVSANSAAIIRFDSVGNTHWFINSILAPTNATMSAIWSGKSTAVHNVVSSKTGAVNNGGTVNLTGTGATDYLGTSAYFGGLAYTAGNAWDSCYWGWNGTLATSANTSKDSLTNINAAISSADSGFYNWLSEVGGTTKDGRGNDRASETWPGAYQN